MSLASGSHIGPYEIVAPIGAGGMGEVYRARDTKLDRQVAIKILPDEFASDADRLMRFEREAKTLASLNHPHIAQIYGFEDRALVMELVEGPTLTELIAAGGSDSVSARGRGLPMAEALAIARQIAEALEAAHGQGIIHRDLKPGNVKVRPDGTVKVLDFGLAKALDPSAGTSGSPPRSMANSPTMSVQGTRAGIILGTAAYMSPEQAAGRVVDKRSDIWAFGVVLFEMLTGRPLFDGESAAHILAEVLKSEPDWNTLPPNTPSSIVKLLRRCLEKKPSARLHDISDARLELEDAIAGRDSVTIAIAGPGRRSSALQWIAIAAAIVAAGAAGRWTVRPVADAPVVRFSVPPPDDSGFDRNMPSVMMSPDGSRLAMIPLGSGAPIYIRRLDQTSASAIAGTGGASDAAFSPDGRWLVFRGRGRKIRKVRIDGGDAPLDVVDGDGMGVAWGPDDTIVFNPSYEAGLWRISAAGGTPTKLTEPDHSKQELGHFWPQFLPDGRVIFTSFSSPIEKSSIEIVSLTGQRTKVIDGAVFARYVPTGHLVYLRAEAVVAAPFDLKTSRLTGSPVPILDDVLEAPSNGIAQISIANNGTMAYLSRSTADPPGILSWVDRAGNTTPITKARRRYSDPALSPDGTRLAVTIEEGSRDIWVNDLQRDLTTRVASSPSADFSPIWLPDNKSLIYVNESPVYQLFRTTLGSTEPPHRVLSTPYDNEALSVTPDGKTVLYDESNPQTSGDLMSVSSDGAGTPVVIVRTPANERSPTLSPDGRLVAYTVQEGGAPEIYVQAYPKAGSERWQVSHDGGDTPHWSRDGSELFFVSRGRMMAASVTRSPVPAFGVPTVLFDSAHRFLPFGYDVAPRRGFVMIARDPEIPLGQATVVLNWFQELRAKMR